MVKVINAPNTRRCTCPRCGSTLEYSYSDIEHNIDHDYVIKVDTYTDYITCPRCQEEVILNQYFKDWY